MAKTTAALAAQEIRKELKALLPKEKFKFKSENFSMGSSVDVYATDLPPFIRSKIEEVIKKYEYGRFDSMTDCYEYTNRNDNIPQAKYVTLNVSRSDEMDKALIAFMVSFYSDCEGLTFENHNTFYLEGHRLYASELMHRLFRGSFSYFWDSVMERFKQAA